MICGHCGETGAAETCAACGQPALLDGRYRLEAVVGRGAAGITYRATRVADGREVAIKEMQFHRIDAEKVRALYTREATVLRQLDHPAIPDYVDHFVAGSGKHRSLYLAQSFIDGQTLTAEMQGRRYREEEVLAAVAEVAGILVYLHDLRPPVIHRDIKPGNIMRRTDGALVLVDFGAVRDALADPALGGSTVVGTYGFMAPEQYRGDASPASDLYALGVTAAVLLSRQPAEALSDVPGRVDWRAHLDVHPATAALLDDLIEADPTRRLGDARALINRAEQAIAAITRDRETARRTPSRPSAPPPVELRAPRPAPEPFPDSAPARGRSGGIGGAMLGAGAMVAVLIGVFVSLVDNPRPSAPSAEQTVAGALCAGDCRAPHGLKGLEFGMTVAQARAALPEFTDDSPEPITVDVSPPTDSGDPTALMQAMMLAHSEPVGGPAYDVQTTLGSLPASCRLEFAVDETLSRMHCTLDRQPDLGSHMAAEQALYAALRERYGRPSDEERPPDERVLGTRHDFSATWLDGEAEAELSSGFQSFEGMAVLPPQSSIGLDNRWSRHRDAIAAAEARGREKMQQTRHAKDEAARRAAEEARRVIEQARDKLTDDL